MPALLRRREIWWPTAWGGLLLLLGLGGAAALAVLGLRSFLSIDAPARAADGSPARLLVVEGWITPGEMDQALALIRRGGYTQVVTSGGPINQWPAAYPDFATRARHYLLSQGLPPGVSILTYPAPPTAQDRSYASAVWVRDGLRAAGAQPTAIDIFTAGVHARRTRTVTAGPKARR